jgi:hypothetical protein
MNKAQITITVSKSIKPGEVLDTFFFIRSPIQKEAFLSQLLRVRHRNGSLTFKDNLSVVTKSEPVTPEVILKQSILIG